MNNDARYQEWRRQRSLPPVRFLLWFSALAWPVNAVTAPLALSGDRLERWLWIALGLNFPAVCLTLVLLSTGVVRHLNLAISVTIVVVGTSMTWGMALSWESPAGVVASGLWCLMLCPFLRLPIGYTIAAAFPLVGSTAAAMITQFDLPETELFPALGIMSASLALGIPFALLNERVLRASFDQEITIENQRALIRRYAPSSVVSRIEDGDTTVDQPHRRKVTVFFSDVVGFTSMADRVDPEALATIVNDYLGSVADLIERHGGTLNEFAGDGVMALFGAPDDMEPQAQVLAALAAAQELQDSLPVWSQDWYQHGIVADAQARIGINTGTISVGTFGSAVRATYTGIGLQTNIAARVQAQAEPGRTLLAHTSWHLVKDQVPCEPKGSVEVKGVHFPIELYQPERPGPG